MNIQKKVKIMTIAGLLSALGIVIPMFAPKIPLPPASFTLASHVPIFIAMFISPVVAVLVALTTTLGFFMTSFPPIIVLRALTHIIFAFIGACALKKYPTIMNSRNTSAIFALIIGFIHALCEVIVVTYFYFYKGTDLSELFHQKGYFITVILLVGVGGMIHSLVDYVIAVFVWKPIKNIVSIIN